MKKKTQDLISKCTTFKGRMTRMRYLMMTFFVPIAVMCLFTLLTMGLVSLSNAVDMKVVTITVAIILLALVIPYLLFVVWVPLAATVRRLHDINFSGRWLFIPIVLIALGIACTNYCGCTGLLMVGGIVQFLFNCVLLFMPGTKGANHYGQNPRELTQ